MECRQSLQSSIIHEKNASVPRRAAWIIEEGLSSSFIFAAVTGLNNFNITCLKRCWNSPHAYRSSHRDSFSAIVREVNRSAFTQKKNTQKKSQTLVRQQEGLRFPHLSLLLPQFSALNFSAHLMGAVCSWETCLSSQRLWIMKQSGLASFTVRWVSPGQMAHNHISVCFSKIFSEKVLESVRKATVQELIRYTVVYTQCLPFLFFALHTLIYCCSTSNVYLSLWFTC